MANIVYMAKSAWTNLLDTIRSKASVSGTMTVSQATTAVENIQTGGGGGDLSFDDVALRTIIKPSGSASLVGDYAFACCSMVSMCSFPNAEYIGLSAFCSTILQSAIFPNVISIHNNAFQYCNRLSYISFSKCVSIGNYGFGSCPALTSVELPSLKDLQMWGFGSCTSLSYVRLDNISNIGNHAFRNCTRLLSVYIMASSVPVLGGSSVFLSTPIGGRTTDTGGVYGSIFVPASLYNQYKTAQYWSAISSRIVSVSE